MVCTTNSEVFKLWKKNAIKLINCFVPYLGVVKDRLSSKLCVQTLKFFGGISLGYVVDAEFWHWGHGTSHGTLMAKRQFSCRERLHAHLKIWMKNPFAWHIFLNSTYIFWHILIKNAEFNLSYIKDISFIILRLDMWNTAVGYIVRPWDIQIRFSISL